MFWKTLNLFLRKLKKWFLPPLVQSTHSLSACESVSSLALFWSYLKYWIPEVLTILFLSFLKLLLSLSEKRIPVALTSRSSGDWRTFKWKVSFRQGRVKLDRGGLKRVKSPHQSIWQTSGLFSRSFLATLVALHFTPVSKSVSEWVVVSD